MAPAAGTTREPLTIDSPNTPPSVSPTIARTPPRPPRDRHPARTLEPPATATARPLRGPAAYIASRAAFHSVVGQTPPGVLSSRPGTVGQGGPRRGHRVPGAEYGPSAVPTRGPHAACPGVPGHTKFAVHPCTKELASMLAPPAPIPPPPASPLRRHRPACRSSLSLVDAARRPAPAQRSNRRRRSGRKGDGSMAGPGLVSSARPSVGTLAPAPRPFCRPPAPQMLRPLPARPPPPRRCTPLPVRPLES